MPKQIKFCLFNHYSVYIFEETRININFLQCQNFNGATEAYDNFILKIMVAIDNVAPIRKRWIKYNSQKWFDDEISEAMKNSHKLFKKSGKSRPPIDKELYIAARYKMHKLIFNKKKCILEIN